MKVSNLIKRLEELQRLHGDVPVFHCGSGGSYNSKANNVEAYGEGGVEPSEVEPAVEIYIH